MDREIAQNGIWLFDLQSSACWNQAKKTTQLQPSTNLHEKWRMTQSPKVELRAMKTHSRPWDLIKELWNCYGSATPLCRPFPPFFEQECLYQLPDTCDTIVFWMCGQQITCLFSFIDLHIERNCIQEALFKIHSGGDSSIPRLDLDDQILNLELLLWSTWGALGEVSVFCLWAQCE